MHLAWAHLYLCANIFTKQYVRLLILSLKKIWWLLVLSQLCYPGLDNRNSCRENESNLCLRHAVGGGDENCYLVTILNKCFIITEVLSCSGPTDSTKSTSRSIQLMFPSSHCEYEDYKEGDLGIKTQKVRLKSLPRLPEPILITCSDYCARHVGSREFNLNAGAFAIIIRIEQTHWSI